MMEKGDKIKIRGEHGEFTIKKVYWPRFYTIEHGNDRQFHYDDIEQTIATTPKQTCSKCGRSTYDDGCGITDKGEYYCISCWELINGKKAQGRCLN